MVHVVFRVFNIIMFNVVGKYWIVASLIRPRIRRMDSVASLHIALTLTHAEHYICAVLGKERVALRQEAIVNPLSGLV